MALGRDGAEQQGLGEPQVGLHRRHERRSGADVGQAEPVVAGDQRQQLVAVQVVRGTEQRRGRVVERLVARGGPRDEVVEGVPDEDDVVDGEGLAVRSTSICCIT